MTDQLTQEVFLSRGIDYLEDLGAKLRDLKGFTTLANELIQNADDAPARAMSFDVRNEGLTVDNDGVFSACGAVEAPQCPWKTTKGHMCDFHRFRLVGSGDKRRQEGTTGAFGFGFTAVYQVTDRPEVFSAGRHWILQEERPESERISQCRGCDRCRASNLPGTRFFLPWASDPDSELRQALSVETFTEEDLNELLDELLRSLPTAMIFLKNLQSVTIKDNGHVRLQLERIVESGKVLVTGGDEDRVWHLVQGDFQTAADELRERHPRLIEGKRTSLVTLAIPEEAIRDGRFSACLPTEFSTGLQFHINADFYPTRDRKRILLDSDYQGKWNRAAISAAAEALTENLTCLRDTLGHGRLWDILNSVYRVHQEQEERESSAALSVFWKTLANSLRQTPVFFTANGQWCTADEVYLLYEKQEETALSVLGQMGIACLHSDLRPYFNLLRTQDVGVSLLDLEALIHSLEDLGLDRRVSRDELPGFLQEEGHLDILWNELETLLNRKVSPEVATGQRTRLAHCAVAVGTDRALWPCNQVYRADHRTRDVFGAIDSTIPFLSACGKPESTLESLCPKFSVETALHFVERKLTTLVDEEEPVELDITSVLQWFEDHREEVLRRANVKAALAALPIFPTAQGRRPLIELVLPGGFEDPLGLAGVVDLTTLGARRDFLKDLGAEELTFRGYVVEHLPAAFEQNNLDAEKRRAIVHLLADRIGEIRDDFKIEEILCDLPLVECADGQFRPPGEAFLDVADLEELFGKQANQAIVPSDHAEAVRDLYSWLGVADAPCLVDIAKRVEILVAQPPTHRSLSQIRRVFAHLGRRANAGGQDEDDLARFRRLAWLPARGHKERWFEPDELHAVFNEYLFESQAVFLDIEHNVQIANARFLELLGVQTKPNVAQVTGHLLWCSENGKQVNKEVYRWLNDNAEKQSVGRLIGKACLLLPSGAYVRPDEVFWGEHPFGHYRYRLGQEMRSYARFLDRLGVKERPDRRDALAVLAEIEQKYAPGNLLLDEPDLGILLGCWQILGEDLDGSVDDEDLAEEMRETLEGLSARKVIPDRRGLLSRPGWLLFEDRPGIASKFQGTLGNNIIPRPQKAWRAMQLAGVRHLSEALRSDLVECRDSRDDVFVFERVQERRQELRRVIETRTESQTIPDADDLLRQIICQVADELVIQYRVEGFGTIPLSEPENVKAHYHRESHTLFSCPGNDGPPWTAIARELALALCPGSEPGGLASGIKEVLAADDPQAANTVLDELGYPMAPEAVATPTATTDEAIQDFGGEETTGGEPLGTPDDGAGGVSEVDEVKVITAEQPTPGQDVITPEQAIESILGPSVRQPTPPPEELDTTDRPGGTGGSGDNTQRGRGTRKGRRKPPSNGAKLRTYVVPGIGGEAGQPAEAAGGRNPVDEAGMARVLEFEKMAGREPKPMPVTHPGYDVESFNGAKEIERFIEVKSLSGTWSSLGAALTDTQFEKAEKEGNRYWLYVIERAQENDYRIYRIQDPARKVNQFIFDDGWRVLAEEDEGVHREGDHE